MDELGIDHENNHDVTVEVDHFTKFSLLIVDRNSGLPIAGTLDPEEAEEAEEEQSEEVKFSDISGHWAEQLILQAAKLGMVNGYPDGTFKPDGTVTRAEFTVMMMSVLQAVQLGIMTGYEDDTFRPNRAISRSEMAVIVARALNLTTNADAPALFSDDADIPVWAKGHVVALHQLNAMTFVSK